MVKDHVEDDVQPCIVGGVDQVFEVLGCAEVRVHFKEVLRPIAVVVIGAGPLPQYWADPERGHPQPLQVADFGLIPFSVPPSHCVPAVSQSWMSVVV